MADGLPDITRIGQAALALPTDIFSLEVRQMNEKMGVLSAKAQEAGSILLPTGGLALPGLPNLAQGLPLLPGMAAATPAAAPETRTATALRQATSNKPRSYMQV